MKISKDTLNRTTWYEDNNGEIIEFGDRVPEKAEVVGLTYHTLFPLEITEHIFVVDADGNYKHLTDCNTNIGKGNEDVIIAMVNSGDYTLSEAIVLWSQSCERCMNVLAYKYLNGKDGYAERSEEWYSACGTSCRFCSDEHEADEEGKENE